MSDDHDFTFRQSGNSGPVPLDNRQAHIPADRRTCTISPDDLERVLTNAVRRGLNDAIKTLASEDNVKAFWHRGFTELRDRSSAHVREGVGGAVLRWGAGILAAAGLALWLKFGPWK